MSRLRCLALLVPLLAACPARAAPPAPPAAAQPDPLKPVYEALPAADRRAVQAALGWTGDFNGAVAGNYGPRTRDGLLAYARRQGIPGETVLEPARRAKLLAAADAARRAVGFAPVPDPRAGFALGVPAKLLPTRTALPNGTRHAAPDGGTTLDVVGRAAGADALTELYGRLSRETPDRRVTYKIARPDFIVVAGNSQDHKFYSRYAVGPGPAGGQLLRGFVLTYPADSAEMDRIALAVAASFDPFAPAAAPEGAVPSAATPVPSTPPPSAATSLPPSGVLSGEAVLVGPGLALTRIARDRCPEADVGGVPASWARQDAPSGLALLALPGRREARPIALPPTGAMSAPGEGARYALFLPGDGSAPAVAAAAPDAAGAVRLPLQVADAGVVVIDGSGRLAGLTGPRSGRPVSVGGVLAAARYDLAGPDQVAGFLAAASVPVAPDGGATPSLATAAARWLPLVLPLRCRARATTAGPALP